EQSKFGLNPSQLMRLLEELRAAGRLDILKMVHFHLGSQIPDIRNIKLAMSEVARFYVELRRMGVDIRYVDVGGGLGVDYDGSRSTVAASVNYSMQEYANDVIYTLAEACRENELTMPHVISESGRALTAHHALPMPHVHSQSACELTAQHALLLINVIDVETQNADPPDSIPEDAHPLVHELAATLNEIGSRALREVYHGASFAKEQLRSHFNS